MTSKTKVQCVEELYDAILANNTDVRRPLCPECSEAMIRGAIQEHDDGGWFLVWLCRCKANPDKPINDTPAELYFHDSEILSRELALRQATVDEVFPDEPDPTQS